MSKDEYNLHKGDLSDEEMKREKRSKFIIDEYYTPQRRAPKIPTQLDWRKYGRKYIQFYNLCVIH